MKLQPTCIKCGADLTIDTMKALPDSKGFVCLDCYDLQGPRLTRSGFVDVSKPKEPLRSSTSLTTKQETKERFVSSSDNFFDLQEYVCHNCGYSFKKAPEFEVRVCPYCGRKESIHQKLTSSANEFLD